MNKPNKFSWRARGSSFRYAFKGLRRLVSSEHNAWIHCAAAIAVIAAGLIFGITPMEWCAVVICIGGVIMAEAFNSAIEALADKISPQQDPLIGKAKDLAAGGVLIFAIAAAITGCIIFIPHIVGFKFF